MTRAEAIGSCPEVLESLSQGLSGISFNVGSISNEWATDIENWKEALPCLAFPYETKQICNFDAGAAANYGPTGVTWFQDSVCNAPGQVEEWGVLFSQGPLHEAIREHGGSFTLYRTSALVRLPSRSTIVSNAGQFHLARSSARTMHPHVGPACV